MTTVKANQSSSMTLLVMNERCKAIHSCYSSSQVNKCSAVWIVIGFRKPHGRRVPRTASPRLSLITYIQHHRNCTLRPSYMAKTEKKVAGKGTILSCHQFGNPQEISVSMATTRHTHLEHIPQRWTSVLFWGNSRIQHVTRDGTPRGLEGTAEVVTSASSPLVKPLSSACRISLHLQLVPASALRPRSGKNSGAALW